MTDAASGSTRRSSGPGADETRGLGPACPVGFCPVGMFLTFAGQARPEVTEHLMNAGRELLLAATALLNARADMVAQKPRMEKIDIE